MLLLLLIQKVKYTKRSMQQTTETKYKYNPAQNQSIIMKFMDVVKKRGENDW